MVRKYKHFIVILLVAAPMAVLSACQSLLPKLEQGVTAAKKVSVEAKAQIENVRQAATTLPAGDPVRKTLEEKAAQLQRVADDADKYIAAASGVVDGLKNGQLDPNAASVISLLPYGGYAVAGLSVLLALYQRAKASGAISDLTNVVQSWEQVGPPLSDEDKVKAAAIQGPVTSARVDAIKSGL
jgi:hypothetical protein